MKFIDLLTGKSSTLAHDNTASEDAKVSPTVHNLIILDASGSMELIYSQALNGLNETLQTIRHAAIENPELKQQITVLSFSSQRFNEIYRNSPAASTLDITRNEYVVSGCTPLYDAIGKGIGIIDTVKNAGDSVLVTIITDGEENSSTDFTARSIKALIEAKRGSGWVFSYIGANQDLEKVAEELSINHTLAFTADEESTRAMFERQNNSRRNFYSRVCNLASNADCWESAQASDEDFSF